MKNLSLLLLAFCSVLSLSNCQYLIKDSITSYDRNQIDYISFATSSDIPVPVPNAYRFSEELKETYSLLHPVLVLKTLDSLLMTYSNTIKNGISSYEFHKSVSKHLRSESWNGRIVKRFESDDKTVKGYVEIEFEPLQILESSFFSDSIITTITHSQESITPIHYEYSETVETYVDYRHFIRTCYLITMRLHTKDYSTIPIAAITPIVGRASYIRDYIEGQ